MITITQAELKSLASLIHEVSGIVLDESKGYLFENRCLPLLENLGLRSFNELYNLARQQTNKEILNRLIEAVATNETSFFRDIRPFQAFSSKILPDLLLRMGSGTIPRPITIWSAACSTGQEAYSLAITIKESLGQNNGGYQFRILGTDISDTTVAQASRGAYTSYEISRGVSSDCTMRYFVPRDGFYQVRDNLLAMTSFKKYNLLDPLAPLGLFDIVFCRNVAIYFSVETRKKLFDRIADQLQPGGVLVIGSTESLIGISERFERHEYNNAIYYQVRK